MSRQDELTILKKAVKIANDRLYKLERRGLNTPAYEIAMNDIKNIVGKDARRFKANAKMSYNDMQRALKYVNKFINYDTSTVSGLKKVMSRRDKTMTKKYGVNGAAKLNTLYKVLSSSTYSKLAELIPSEMVVSAVTESIQNGKSGEDIMQVMEFALLSENDTFLADELEELLNG